MATATDFLSSYIEPLADELTPQQARTILGVKPSDDLIGKVQTLADKASAGTLSVEERAEYEYYIDIDDVIGLLKAKARNILGR